jgi:hypothetical protein
MIGTGLNQVNGEAGMIALQVNKERFSPNAGIAIGPILFIIAILAILAAAIAAGSGSFTAGTGTETNKTKSSALMQIGENLRVGMDRITMEGGLGPTQVTINPANTSSTSDLFSPTGGGIAPPSPGMANNPTVDTWTYPSGIIKGLGTQQSTSPVIVAVLPVSQGVCAEVNNRAMGSAVVPPPANYGTFETSTDGSTILGSAWPESTTTSGWTNALNAAVTTGFISLAGVATGCVWNTGVPVGAGCTAFSTAGVCTGTPTAGPSSQFFYYQVLAIQ